MPGQTISNEQLWAMYAAGIAGAAGFAAVPQGFILCGTSLIADLAVASKALPAASVPNMQEALFQVYNLANTAVALQGIYSPTQHYFFSDYASYIDNLVPAGSQKAPTETQAGQLRLFQSQLTDANNQYNTDQNAAYVAWSQTGSPYPTFQSFLNATNWGAMLNADNAKSTKISSQIQNLLTTIYGVDYLAIQTDKSVVDNVRNAMQGSVGTGPYDMLVQATSGNLVVPSYSPSDLNIFSAWVDLIIERHNNQTGVPPVKINFSPNTAKGSLITSAYFTQTNWDVNNFFFSALNGDPASGSQINIDTGAPGFTLQFQFDDITQVSVTRGPWFNAALTSSPYVYPNPDNLATPVNLIIGMYPQVKMTLDAASYAAAYSAYNSAGGFGFGNFWVSASHKQDAAIQPMTASWNNTANAVSIESSSINPVILAMEVDLLP